MTDEKKTEEEALAEVLDEARAQELEDKLSKMTEDQAAAFLAKHGVTDDEIKESAARERAKLDAVVAEDKKVVRVDFRRRVRDVFFAAGGLAFAATVAGLFVVTGAMTVAFAPEPSVAVTAAAGNGDGGVLPDGGQRTARARELRYDAFRMYALGRWQASLDLFAEAQRLDPFSNEEPAVDAARTHATEMLARSKDGG